MPANVTSIRVAVVGGGGGGGGGLKTGSSTGVGGGGGGGGELPTATTFTVVPGETYKLSVGAGGAGGASATSSPAGNGIDGSVTTFGTLASTLLSGAGGRGGQGGSSTAGGVGGASGSVGGTGSSAVSSDAAGGGGGSSAGAGVSASVSAGGNGADGPLFHPDYRGAYKGGGGGGGAATHNANGGGGGSGGGGYGGGMSAGLTGQAPNPGGYGNGGGGGGGAGNRSGTPDNGASGGTGSVMISYDSHLAPYSQTVTGTVGSAITATSALSNAALLASSGGVLTFALDSSSPALPAGLGLSATTGVITGTPTATQSATTLVVRATNADRDWATAQVTISVTSSGGSGGGGGGGAPAPAPEPTPTASATPTPTATPAASEATVLGPVTNTANSGVPAGGVAPGTGVLIVNGEKVSVTVKPDARDSKLLEVSGPGFTMSLAGLNAQGQPLGLTPDGALILEQDRTAAVAGTGFQPNSLVYLYLFSEPRFLGTVQTDANGSFKGSVPLPADIADGRHTLQSNGFTPDGTVRSLSLGVVLATPVAATPKRATAKVYFESLSSVLTEEGMSTLKTLVKKTGKKGVRTASIGYVQGTTVTANDEALSTQRAKNVAAYLKKLGLKGRFVVRGDGIAKESGPTARRVNISVTYLK